MNGSCLLSFRLERSGAEKSPFLTGCMGCASEPQVLRLRGRRRFAQDDTLVVMLACPDILICPPSLWTNQ